MSLAAVATRVWPFFVLSYPVAPPLRPDSFPNSQYYEVGLLDGLFILGWSVLWVLMREGVMRLFKPIARRRLLALSLSQRAARAGASDATTNGHAATKSKTDGMGNGHSTAVQNGSTHEWSRERKSSMDVSPSASRTRRETMRAQAREKKVTRFAEQGWSVFYYSIFWTYGMYIHISLPTYPFNTDALWEGFPHYPLPSPIKAYYLLQFAFWITQLVTINVEARRKDHWQMLTHHIITLALVAASYISGFTRAGCLVLVLLDLCDILLSLAKMLKYLEYAVLPDVIFVAFLVTWLVTRQVLYFKVAYSTTFDARKVTTFEWDPSNGKFESGIQYGCSAALWVLGVLLCIWFGMICRVAYRVITGKGAEDTRSDDEDE
ncbi:hypothetical protein BOTBODRAFT_98865 [Botryobasidium botryosum FD-172 SS1]|uniref:TLC domain-containing protein n=1 Tax=Botryobasidium botryosum (strain FD-172 SS1) TaxID=930990 RepID=A0A067NBW1_BOTB1|nr:hypothetical protein BOTBODRAFT_98865 [Botryobasidium botryosum FD-172 SS1]